MKTMYVQAKFIRSNIRKMVREGQEILMLSGAKLYADKIGAVWHYRISGYSRNGDDVNCYQWAKLKSQPIINESWANYGDTDGDFLPAIDPYYNRRDKETKKINRLGLKEIAALGWLNN